MGKNFVTRYGGLGSSPIQNPTAATLVEESEIRRTTQDDRKYSHNGLIIKYDKIKLLAVYKIR